MEILSRPESLLVLNGGGNPGGSAAPSDGDGFWCGLGGARLMSASLRHVYIP